MLFSQRKGLNSVRDIVQKDSMSEELRNGLWDVTYEMFFKDANQDYRFLALTAHSTLNELTRKLWHSFFKIPLDTIPWKVSDVVASIRKHFFKCEWFEVYDFIEFLACFQTEKLGRSSDFTKACNSILEREMSAYRFISTELVVITSEEEIKSIESAVNLPTKYQAVRTHLETALERLSDRTSPDYRNSIKESISAVEALAKIISGDKKADLDKALKSIANKVTLHNALRNAFLSLYAYTSDEKGIRHALLEESKLDSSDAKFMLVACSAFVNYVIEKYK